MLLLYNGRIFTQEDAIPVVSALVIQEGRILFSGSEQEAIERFPNCEQKFDLQGKIVLPGLCDAHMHLEYYALNLQRVACETNSLQECLERVAVKAQQSDQNAWILGHGWNQNQWDNQYGTAAQLDSVCNGRPVYLTAKSYHAAWVNTKVLNMAGISRHTPDPEGGKLSRDEKGNPTGILFESAVELVKNILPKPSVEDSRRAILEAQTTLWKMGLTAVHDFDGSSSFSALQELDIKNQLRLRVTKSIPVDNLDAAIKVGLRSGYGSSFLKIGSIKCFADGALGPQTAAMIEPFNHAKQTPNGILMLDAELIFEIGQKAVQNGLSLAVHAIGDRATHEMINGLSMLRQFERVKSIIGLRHRIEHVQLLQAADIDRLAQNDLIASVQPIHATSDMDIADTYWGNRSQFAYAYSTLIKAQTRMAFGSDAPVESPNPFLGLHAAVTRRRTNGYPGESGWYPEQRITLKQALEGFTTGAAYASGQELSLGRLTSGYFADLIVLRTDPFAVDAQELWTQKPTATMVAGEWVWME